MDMVGIVASIVAIAGLMLSLVRIVAGNMKSELSARDVEQEKQITKMQKDLDALEKHIGDTRTEMHKEYVQHEQMDRAMSEIKATVNNIFARIDAMSRDLNVMRGKTGPGHE